MISGNKRHRENEERVCVGHASSWFWKGLETLSNWFKMYLSIVTCITQEIKVFLMNIGGKQNGCNLNRDNVVVAE